MPSWMRWATAVVMSLATLPVATALGQTNDYFQASNPNLPPAAGNNIHFQMEELADRVKELEAMTGQSSVPNTQQEKKKQPVF